MSNLRTVELTLITAEKVYVPLETFNLGGVPEKADSVIGNYIKGSREPMLKVNSASDMTGTWSFVNPKMIVKMVPTYA